MSLKFNLTQIRDNTSSKGSIKSIVINCDLHPLFKTLIIKLPMVEEIDCDAA